MNRHRIASLSQRIFVVFGAVAVLAAAAGVLAQDASVSAEEIIRKFAAKETQFQAARENYTYTQDIRVQEMDSRGNVAGEYHETIDIVFDDRGRRIERTTFAPLSTLRRISMSPEDMENIRSLQPFVLTTSDIPKYDLRYVGKEQIDDIGCHVFEVKPKKIEKNQRYFEGTIWVDDLDLQIVKTYGKPVPDISGKRGQENLFPKFETYRQQIDDYWFPTYTRTDDTLNFSTGPVRVRQIIRYQNYKRFTSDVTITVGGLAPQEPDKAKPAEGAGK
jgi:hypothetical protein